MYLDEQPVVPYETLRYLISVINYGGRVTDNKDERCISALLSNYVCENALNQGYSFSESGIYKIPDDISLESAKSYIDQLPLDDKPEVFGLHDNANITFEINQVKAFMDTLIQVQPQVAAGGAGGDSTDM